MSKRVVITGLGVIAPNGIGRQDYWNAVLIGRSGIIKISKFDTSDYPSKIAAEVSDFNPADYIEKKQARRLSRFAQFSLAASWMASLDAGINIKKENPYKTGIALGTAVGGLEIAEKECGAYFAGNLHGLNPLSSMSMNPNSALGIIAVDMGIKGPNMTISTGCSAGLSAIGYSYDIVSNGRADVMITGGAEAPLFPVTFGSFCSAEVLTRRNSDPSHASRPFDRFRDGYVLGEGAGMLVVESLEHALERHADIYAEILGYGVTNDGYSVFKMEPDGKEAAKTIELALLNSGLSPCAVSYINAHGSSSVVSDRRETSAIKQVFGEHAYHIPISSIKSMVGQSLAATASLQLVTAALAVKYNRIPPTINYEEPDPACDLDYVPNVCRDNVPVEVALVNSFGAGGNNICMLLGKYHSEVLH